MAESADIKAHSTLSPSGAHRWVNCPGSVRMSAGKPDQRSQYAAEGVVAHTLAELHVTGKKSTSDLLGMVGDIVEQDGFEVEITDEMVEGAFEYHDIIAADRAGKELGRSLQAKEIVGEAEVRVQATSVHRDAWGTSDYVLYQVGRFITVYDYKFGKGIIVDVEGNEQLALYLIGVLDKLGWVFSELELVVHQPRSSSEPKRWRVSVEDLKKLRDFLKERAKATEAPDAPVIAGPWCKFCRAQADCPATYAMAQRGAEADFATSVDNAPPLPAVESMSLGKLSAALKYQEFVENWFAAVKARIQFELEAGVEVPDWKLVEGRSNRKWVSEEAMKAHYEPILGDSIYKKKKLIGPAAIEKLAGKKALLAELVEKPEGRKTIARSTDRRPEVVVNAAADFIAADVNTAMAEL